jgi:hypothetical protein
MSCLPKAMFVSRNSLFGKPLSKLSCVCLPLGKLVNGNHFPVNENPFPVNENPFRSTDGNPFPVNRRKPLSGQRKPLSGQQTETPFRSTENTFQSKKNLVWFPGKYFPFWLCLFSGKWFSGNHFPNFPVFVCH